MQWSSSQKGVSKFTPKQFYEIDPRLERHWRNQHCYLWQTFVNYGHKKIYNIGLKCFEYEPRSYKCKLHTKSFIASNSGQIKLNGRTDITVHQITPRHIIHIITFEHENTPLECLFTSATKCS